MRFAETSSWQVRIDAPQALMVGLYVRDAAGLRPPADVDVPPLVPGVEVRASLVPFASMAASVQWARWWNGELLQAGGGHGRAFCAPDPEFGDGPELCALTHECAADAARWSSDRKREHARAPRGIEGDLVRAVEQELGRKARPFELLVTELPVTGAAGWRLSPGHVVVSAALRNDPVAYRQWLTPVIRALA